MQGCGVRRARSEGREYESASASTETGAETGDEVPGNQCGGAVFSAEGAVLDD